VRSLKPIPLSLVVLAASVANATAHSLDELETQLGDREQYFQPVNQDAPRFALEDAEGRGVSLEDLRGKATRAARTSVPCTPSASPRSRR